MSLSAVNYVLYNENQQFDPANLRMAIFSPKYQPNYALRVIQDSQSADGRFDVKFIEVCPRVHRCMRKCVIYASVCYMYMYICSQSVTNYTIPLTTAAIYVHT